MAYLISKRGVGDSRLSETRDFNARYFPTGVELAGTTTLFDWDYTTDAAGNILSIDDVLAPSASRTYTYQDVQYFLTQGDGPWGTHTWTYDRIGNRLTETRTPDFAFDEYLYKKNADNGNTATLFEIQPSTGDARLYAFGPAGHFENLTVGTQQVQATTDAEGRLSRLQHGDGSITAFRYDGRSYLVSALGEQIFTDGFESGDVACWSSVVGGTGAGGICAPPSRDRGRVGSVYSSEGVLHSVGRVDDATGIPATQDLLYFAGRPVAQIETTGQASTLTYLTTDHLGTPVAATDSSGALVWSGGFSPFGEDFSGASEAGVFLRFPGQWVDGVWDGVEVGFELYQNVHRWYTSDTGRYTRPDPARLFGEQHPYLYAMARPVVFIDPLGRRAVAFLGCEVWFFDDDWNIVKKCPAGSGLHGTGIDDQSSPFEGPIPEGDYYFHPREFSGGWLRDLIRPPGWGRWRVPLHPGQETETFGRTDFFFHGDNRPNRPDTLGCVDIGNCDTSARDWAMQEPDRPILFLVRYIQGRICN